MGRNSRYRKGTSSIKIMLPDEDRLMFKEIAKYRETTMSERIRDFISAEIERHKAKGAI